MKKILSCICALSVCGAMLSACGTQESTTQTGTVSNSETTSSTENVSETIAAEADTESTTEETEAAEEINYQKKRVIYYPVDGDSYVFREYEYGDGNYINETVYDSVGNISRLNEYKNDILVKITSYSDGVIRTIEELDESEINYLTKMLQYNENQELVGETFWDYQFNDDRTEALETCTTIFYNPDTGERDEYEPQYCTHTYEYDATGHLIHTYYYDEISDYTSVGEYYEYDDNENRIMYNFADAAIYTYEYDENNNLIYEHYDNVTYGYSNDTYYDYDEYGRQIGWTVYDADGNEKSHSVVEY